MSRPISDDVRRLVRALFAEHSGLDRVPRHDHRFATLTRIAAAREFRIVPDLLPVLTADETLAPHVAAVVAQLVHDATPVQLAWLDEQVRHGSYAWPSTWHGLPPAAISRLALTYDLNAALIGLLASHANGFVRAAAVEVLARYDSGQEIPFLSLRTNDWVEPVAARATTLLASRMRPDNRHAVLDALPFIVRVLGQRRRDHRELARGLASVLLSDGGDDALARAHEFDPLVRRTMYELLTAGGTTATRRMREAALTDPDAVIRAYAIRWIAENPDVDDRGATLEAFVCDDRVPMVRRLALAVLTEHMPERLGAVFPQVLLDRAASVRSLARTVASTRQLALVPRTVYIEALAGTLPGPLAAAIAGIGEVGGRADADLVAPFLGGSSPRIRRAALTALAKLDAERGVSAALAALPDDAVSVRTAAVRTLSSHARLVDFDLVSRQVSVLSDPKARRSVLRLFLDAPKWEGPAFLLEALRDQDDGVRASAIRLLERWIEAFNRSQTQPTVTQSQRIGALLDALATRMPKATASLLRFSIKPL